MVRRKNIETQAGMGTWAKFISALIILLLISASAATAKSEDDLRKEIQDLKQEVKAMQEKLGQLQAGQQAMLDLLKKPALPEMAAPAFQPPQAPAAPQPLTVGQLLAGKDQYLGSRVTVRGPVGPVLVHHKSMLLKAPEGMVEVRFGKIPDQKLVQQLTSTPLDKPVTVTGVVSLPPKAGTAKLQIDAEAVDF
jgi:hypothetical protein